MGARVFTREFFIGVKCYLRRRSISQKGIKQALKNYEKSYFGKMRQMCSNKTQGVYIEVVVKPRAKKTQVPTRIEENTIFVNIKAPPKANKANKELLRELSNLFNTSQDRITIVSGHRSMKKIVFLEMDPEAVKRILSQFKNCSF